MGCAVHTCTTGAEIEAESSDEWEPPHNDSDRPSGAVALWDTGTTAKARPKPDAPSPNVKPRREWRIPLLLPAQVSGAHSGRWVSLLVLGGRYCRLNVPSTGDG